MRPLPRLRPLAFALCASLALGCGGRGTELELASISRDWEISEVQLERARVQSGSLPELSDPSGGAWRVIEVPQLGSLEAIVETPLGWLALSSRTLGCGKTPVATESALYRSSDGVRWQLVRVTESEGDLRWRGLAYGNGTYVVSGGHDFFGDQAATWTSADGVSWVEHAQSVDSSNGFRELSFAAGRFFAFATYGFFVSRDGVRWSNLGRDTLQTASVAYGNGRYVVVGNGPAQVSSDAERWQSHAMDCQLFDDCVVDPSGGVHPTPLANVLFAEGRFHARERVSDNGETWQPAPRANPSLYVAGHFVEAGRSRLELYRAGGERWSLRVTRPSIEAARAEGRSQVGQLDRDAPIPELVEVPFEDGLSCETATCLVIGRRLLLVPPEGAPPIADRLPRGADGMPLLSDECPVSSQIFCSDYAARTDCRCDAEAPRSPEGCADVSQYECEGAFEPRSDEWRVEEVAQAGCRCTASDPNQPPTFGQDCDPAQSACAAPLECLPIDAPPSCGPPFPRSICTAPCSEDADCPSWQATGFCAGPVRLRCSGGSCQPRGCE